MTPLRNIIESDNSPSGYYWAKILDNKQFNKNQDEELNYGMKKRLTDIFLNHLNLPFEYDGGCLSLCMFFCFKEEKVLTRLEFISSMLKDLDLIPKHLPYLEDNDILNSDFVEKTMIKIVKKRIRKRSL